MIKELLRGLKWVIVALGVMALLIALWLGCAWSLGWAFNHFFDLRNFSPEKFISLGSCALVFTIIIQAVTIILIGWVLLAYGRAHGFPRMNNKSPL